MFGVLQYYKNNLIQFLYYRAWHQQEVYKR
jgi:hypothetical protein